MVDRILILGASGFVGLYLFKILQEAGYLVTGTGFQNMMPGLIPLNLLDRVEVSDTLAKVNPDLVIFLSGTKDINRCEYEPDYAVDMNIQAVKNYIDSCRENNQSPTTLFFSTDYVFDGCKGFYRASDKVSPCTVYGATNMLSERLLMLSGLPGKVLRVSAVMGRNGGFFRWLESHLCNSKPLSLYENTHFSPTSIGRVCQFVTKYARSISVDDVKGEMNISHLSDGYRMSRYQFGCSVAACMGIDAKLIVPEQLDIEKSFSNADLSLIPDGMTDFLDPAGWNELKHIF
jgi:dTDP-4-dehydrorhamnose reductase